MKTKKEILGFRKTFFPLVKWGTILLLVAKPIDFGIGLYSKAKADTELKSKTRVACVDTNNTKNVEHANSVDVNELRLVYSEPNQTSYDVNDANEVNYNPNLSAESNSVDSNSLEVVVDANSVDVNEPNVPAEPNSPIYAFKMSQKGIDFIKEFEKFEDIAYKCPAGVWTIGYGHTKGVKKGDKITKKKALKFLSGDISDVEGAISKNVTVPLTQQQHDSLGSLIYNIGGDRFSESTLLKRLNKGKYDEVSEQITRWNKVKGKTLRGLINRRTDETEMWKKADYIRNDFD